MDNAIIVRDITKVFRIGHNRQIVALDNVSFEVKEGEFFGLLGPNGAGKTTLTKIISTLLIPDSGEVLVNGYSIYKEPMKVRQSIGWMQGETGGRALYWRLSGYDNLKYFATLQGVNSKVAEIRIKTFLKFLDLDKDAYRLVKDYSTGMKIKLLLIRALLHNPPILILDEPTVGLDVASAIKIREFLRELNEELNKTILFTSHNMTEVEQLCDRIAIINKGKIIFVGSARQMKEKVEKVKVVSLKVRMNGKTENELVSSLMKMNSVEKILSKRNDEGIYEFRIAVRDPYETIPELVTKLKDWKIEAIERSLPTLEEAFIRILGGDYIE